MGRCPFVQAGVVRLWLADVHRRAIEDLKAKAADPKTKSTDKPTADAIAYAEALLAESVENGYWIEVHERLNAGQRRHIFTGLVSEDDGMVAGEKIKLDPDKVGNTKILEYVTAWSMTNAEGQPEPFDADSLDNLDPDIYKEISDAIDWHESQQEAKREQEIKNRVGANISG